MNDDYGNYDDDEYDDVDDCNVDDDDDIDDGLVLSACWCRRDRRAGYVCRQGTMGQVSGGSRTTGKIIDS